VSLRLDEEDRRRVWKELSRIVEEHAAHVDAGRVTPELNPQKIRDLLKPCDFEYPMDPVEATELAAFGLTQYQVHTPHPRYYGLFNPAPTTMGIVADALVAAFNPQLAAWSHSPFAAEVEAHLIRAFGERFGYPSDSIDGAFTSGGMEANHTAVLSALTDHFPDLATKGLRALPAQPVLYVSAESHHSLLKSARLCGLGMDSVRQIAVDDALRMKPEALQTAIKEDKRSGLAPFLVVATAGTTNAGAIDPLLEIADIAQRYSLWYHVDAAWGGAAAFVPELEHLLNGINRADSITFDAHKWLSVPMGAGVYITQDPQILHRTFRVATAYMPREAAGLDIVDPHLHTMQWSRRFIGLKVFLSLLVAGWDGYAEAIRHQVQMGELLRDELVKAGWEVVNQTALAVVCFVDPAKSAAQHQEMVLKIVNSGEAWLSTTVAGASRTVMRACITNYRTQPTDVLALVQLLENVR
jgi:glutamate/tyrosine decarboxylase-like PLP-dependent enzyme